MAQVRTKSIDLGLLQDHLAMARKVKLSASRKLANAQEADLRAGDELKIAQSELDAAFHSIRNQ